MDIHKGITHAWIDKVCHRGLIQAVQARAPPATSDHSPADDRDDSMLTTRAPPVSPGDGIIHREPALQAGSGRTAARLNVPQ